MKIYQKLAVATAGVAFLACVKIAPAAATSLSLSGNFGRASDPVDNGWLVEAFNSNGLDSYVVNLSNATGPTVATLNSTNPDSNGSSSGSPHFENLTFFGVNNELRLNLTSGFAGTVTVLPYSSNVAFPSVAQTASVNADPPSSASEAVPEPEKIVGTVVAGYFFWQMHRKIASHKAKA